MPTQCQRFCEAEIINHLFQCIWKCHFSVDLWCGRLQREGNCPLNACAFAKLKLLTIFFRVYLEMPFFQWICGVVLWHAAGRHLPTQCPRSCFRCCQGSHCLLNGRAFASWKVRDIYLEQLLFTMRLALYSCLVN